MSLHYSNGLGMLYEKDSDLFIDKVNYQLVESDATRYTRKRWWGELISAREIKNTGTSFILEMADGRRGECFVYPNQELLQKAARHFYHFNGRSRLGNRRGLL